MTYVESTLEEVLKSVQREEREPTYSALQDWIALFPDYQDALADYFAEWAMDTELKKSAEIDEELLANRLVSHALNILHQNRQRAPEVKSQEVKPLRLFQAISLIGSTREEFAERLRLTEEVLVKIDLRRLINMPKACFAQIQNALNLPDDIFNPMVTGPPIQQAGTSFKSAKRPQPRTEDFLTAIRNSSLSKEDKDFWIAATLAERSKDQDK